MTIRPALPTDAIGLQNLINGAFKRKNTGWIELSYFDQPNIITLIATEGETILGTASLHILPKIDRCMGQIEDVVVSTKAQGKGIGHALIKALLEHSSAQKCYKIILNTAIETAPFYEKMGFEKGEIQMKIKK